MHGEPEVRDGWAVDTESEDSEEGGLNENKPGAEMTVVLRLSEEEIFLLCCPSSCVPVGAGVDMCLCFYQFHLNYLHMWFFSFSA